MINNRLKRLERYIKPVRQNRNLSALSIPELKELEIYVIKQHSGEPFTAEEVQRINEIIAKVKES